LSRTALNRHFIRQPTASFVPADERCELRQDLGNLSDSVAALRTRAASAGEIARTGLEKLAYAPHIHEISITFQLVRLGGCRHSFILYSVGVNCVQANPARRCALEGF
jgi:hypothetical protein